VRIKNRWSHTSIHS